MLENPFELSPVKGFVSCYKTPLISFSTSLSQDVPTPRKTNFKSYHLKLSTWKLTCLIKPFSSGMGCEGEEICLLGQSQIYQEKFSKIQKN